MSTPTLAEQLIDVVRQAGVQRVYRVVGDSLNPVLDAIRRTDGIERVHVRNQEAGAFAAAAEAQLTGRQAVCAGSCAPGNTHLLQGLKGFALAADKVVLGGGVGNMLELARANARNIPVPAGRR
ncbi:MAG TPA: thiamine pyrophosphate-binding protein [Solirubrobacteraceae bacterium]|nr:thiamine pyrophosphate-binding protein [Solirubrobacteraceae bacterium]